MGSPTQLQNKHATTDGPVRYTAPSLVFEHTGRRLEAGGWQTIEAYDVIVANLIPDGARRGVPDDPLELLTAFPDGPATQEVAQLLTRGNDAPDRVEAEVTMLRLVADGAATRTPLGDDALWKFTQFGEHEHVCRIRREGGTLGAQARSHAANHAVGASVGDDVDQRPAPREWSGTRR